MPLSANRMFVRVHLYVHMYEARGDSATSAVEYKVIVVLVFLYCVPGHLAYTHMCMHTNTHTQWGV